MDLVQLIPYIIIGLVLISFWWILRLGKRRIEERLGLQFKHQVERHYQEVKNIYATMRGWRHDYHNHIQTMKAHIAMDQYEELSGYLDELDEDLMQVDTQIKTGNVMADAILNSKVSLAESHDIKVNIKAQVHEEMLVSDVDLCIIIGNLIDNAIDACLMIEDIEERFIRIYIGRLKDQMYISISNATIETKRNDLNEFVSKKGGLMHGHGLKRVDITVAKYDGFLNRQNEPGIFATEILLPLSEG